MIMRFLTNLLIQFLGILLGVSAVFYLTFNTLSIDLVVTSIIIYSYTLFPIILTTAALHTLFSRR